MKIKVIAYRLLIGVIGAILGAFIGGALTYLAVILFIEEELKQVLIFIMISAITTSQLGLIVGLYFAAKFLPKE
ncbi:MAG: hypothetical protein NE328_24545 [Lentisphaeraceae bacterium]|nr:hypothetical protein [Lentisphaeraceae bacterium]